MSRYRSELPSLRQRIADLEKEVRVLRAEKIRKEAEKNLGPQARHPFSRFMYFLGRGLSHLLRPRAAAMRRDGELGVARQRLLWLERRLAALREEAGEGR